MLLATSAAEAAGRGGASLSAALAASPPAATARSLASTEGQIAGSAGSERLLSASTAGAVNERFSASTADSAGSEQSTIGLADKERGVDANAGAAFERSAAATSGTACRKGSEVATAIVEACKNRPATGNVGSAAAARSRWLASKLGSCRGDGREGMAAAIAVKAGGEAAAAGNEGSACTGDRAPS